MCTALNGIHIIGKVNEEEVQIVIEDSGDSMPSDAISKNNCVDTKKSGNGVGLQNIDSRIKLLYSDAYGITTERKNGYSRVTVSVPRREKC